MLIFRILHKSNSNNSSSIQQNISPIFSGLRMSGIDFAAVAHRRVYRPHHYLVLVMVSVWVWVYCILRKCYSNILSSSWIYISPIFYYLRNCVLDCSAVVCHRVYLVLIAVWVTIYCILHKSNNNILSFSWIYISPIFFDCCNCVVDCSAVVFPNVVVHVALGVGD